MIFRISSAVTLFVGAALFLLNSAPTTRPSLKSNSAVPSLQLLKVWTLQAPDQRRFDPSGLVYWPPVNGFLTINDKLNQVKLFSLSLKASNGKNLKSLRLYHTNNIQIPRRVSKVWKGYRLRLDLEGIAACGDVLWLAAEQTRTLIRIQPKTGVATYHTLNLREYGRISAFDGHPMPGLSRDHNASFEGLACDPKHRRLYVIQERQPRLILQVKIPKSLKNKQVLKIVDHFDLPSFDLPKRYGLVDSEPDFSGADMDGKFLYVLYRNARLVLKVDPIQHKLLGVFCYAKAVKPLYRLSKPFGLAEGIVVQGNRIWLVLDNNGKPRWNQTNDRRPVLLEFKRPKGF